MSDLRERLLELFPALDAIEGEAWVVGGAVRDLVRGVEPIDVDVSAIGAEAIAESTAARFNARVITMGRAPLLSFRVTIEARVYDFAPLQGETIVGDLGRRDFTINAMAVDLRKGDLIDPFGGRKDLRESLLRIVSEQNLDEDPLRVLRGARLAQQLALEIDPRSASAMKERAAVIADVAVERVTSEVRMMLLGPMRERGVEHLRNLGCDTEIFGFALGDASIEAMRNGSGTDLIGALSILLADVSGDELTALHDRWRCPREWRDGIVRVRSLLKQIEGATTNELRILIHDSGLDTARRAAHWLEAFGKSAKAAHVWKVFLEDGEGLERIDALLDGSEISEILGAAPGPEIGRIKRTLLEAQIRGEVTTRDEATLFVRRFAT